MYVALEGHVITEKTIDNIVSYLSPKDISQTAVRKDLKEYIY